MSATALMKESEVMAKLEITSSTTIYKYCKLHNFPKPVRTHLKAYLRSDVDRWILNGSINQRII